MNKLFQKYVTKRPVDDDHLLVRGVRCAYTYDPPEAVILDDSGIGANVLVDVIESHSRAMFEHTRDEIKRRIDDCNAQSVEALRVQIDRILNNLDFDVIVRELKP